MKARDPKAFTKERQILERQVAHMVRLVNDLLDVSRLARGKVQLEQRRFEIRDAVDRAIDMASPLIVQRGHTFDVRVPDRGLTIDGDSARIVQVISNLLTNAAKYAAGWAHRSDGMRRRARSSWCAKTPGPASPRIWWRACSTPLPRGRGRSIAAKAGSGWAGTLARAFAEMHGGTIGYERVDERGSRFILRLPLAADAGLAMPAESSSPVRVTRQRILLVDDNLDANEMLRSALEAAGHEVLTARTVTTRSLSRRRRRRMSACSISACLA